MRLGARDIGWLLLTGLLSLALLHTRCTSRSRADFALVLRDSSLTVAEHKLDSLQAELARRERAIERRRVESERRIVSLERERSRARARAVLLADSLAHDSLAAALARAYEKALAAQDSIIAELSSQLTDMQTNYESQGSLLAMTQKALDDMTKQRDAWRERAQGPRVRFYWGLGAGAVLSAGQWHAGPGIFIGIAIRL